MSERILSRIASSANMLRNSLDFTSNGIQSQPSFEARVKKVTDQIGEIIVPEFDDQSKGINEIVREHVRHFIDNTIIGYLYSQLMIVLNVLSCFQYIYLTYTTDETNRESPMYWTHFYLELGTACMFFLDWILAFLSSENKFNFFWSFDSCVDIMTVLPVLATLDVECPDYEHIDSAAPAIYYTLCAMTTSRILRSLRFCKNFDTIEDEVQRFLADMGLKIVVMILFNAALMQYFEINQNRDFHTWMYYMLVTIATVGYGDITPESVLGRFAAMFMIILAIIIVPQMTNELMEKLSRQSVYARASYEPKTRKASHVLVCGDVKSSSLEEFFHELFHEDHDANNLYAVVLQPGSPSYEMLQILRDPAFSLTVCYLEGNALNEKDLKRAKAGKAKAIFVMTNKFSTDPDEEDAKTILQQFSIQRFLRLHSEKVDSLFCLQLIRPENKRHLVTSGDNSSTDLVICLNEFKMGVIAKAVIFPGANTLIMNLLTSFADDKVFSPSKTLDGIETLDDDEDSDWLGEYQRGCDWEIYTTELSSQFEGATFCTLSEILYQKIGVVLFALEIEDLKKEKSSTRLLLNPADFVIPPKSDYRIDAFVMAKNKAQSDLTFTKTNSEGFIGSGINFSQLSLLANGIASRMSIHHGHAKVHHGGGGAHYEETKEASGERGENREKQAWQMLLRKHEAEKMSESRQEEQQKLEDRMLRANYFIRDTHMDVHDAYIRSSVPEEMPFVDNHIIIIGKALSNLYDLIRPLRARSLGELRHIIIIYPSDFPLAVWQRISIFESIWIIRGSALEEADIRRAGIFKAKQVVVLADSSAVTLNANQHLSGSAAGLDALVDADAIFCYQCVRKMNEQAHVVVEIVRHTNVGYLDPESGLNSSDIDYKFTPQFASGALFATSLLDTLVCQAFYNTKIIDVINKLIGSVELAPREFEKNNKSQPSSPNPGQRRAGNQPAGGGGGGGSPLPYTSMLSSSLYQINIPEGLESRTYGSLYRLLARRKQIPLGILRGVFSSTKSGPKNNKMPYVFTNPPKDTELFTCDKVFVLSQSNMTQNRVIKDETKEMQMYSNLRSRKKTAEDIIHMVQGLKEEVRRMDTKNDAVDARINALSDELNGKFDLLLRALNVNPTNGTPISSPPAALSRGKTMRPGGDRPASASTKNMSIEGFAMQHQQSQGMGQGGSRSRLSSMDVANSGGAGGGGRSRLGSADGGRPRLGSYDGGRPRLGSGDGGRPRLGSGDSGGRPSSAGATVSGRPQLGRTNTSANNNNNNRGNNSPNVSRPVSGQRGRRMCDGKEVVRVGFF